MRQAHPPSPLENPSAFRASKFESIMPIQKRKTWQESVRVREKETKKKMLASSLPSGAADKCVEIRDLAM
jgi:hypothetical protein